MQEDDRPVETPPPMDSAGNVYFYNSISAVTMSETLCQPHFQDVLFHCQSKAVVGASTLLLSMHSDLLKSVLKDRLDSTLRTDDEQIAIFLPDFGFHAVTQMVRYLATGFCDCQTADQYQEVKELLQLLECKGFCDPEVKAKRPRGTKYDPDEVPEILVKIEPSENDLGAIHPPIGDLDFTDLKSSELQDALKDLDGSFRRMKKRKMEYEDFDIDDSFQEDSKDNIVPEPHKTIDFNCDVCGIKI